jgi:hypothetical protein
LDELVQYVDKHIKIDKKGRNLLPNFNPFELSITQRYYIYRLWAIKMMALHPHENLRLLSLNKSVAQPLVNQFLLAARFAYLAYETDENILQQQSEKMGESFIGSVNNGNCYIFVGIYNGTQIVGIQGTEFVSGDRNIYQVWSDLSITPKYVAGYSAGAPTNMYVHSGFYDDLANLWPQVEILLNYNKPIWICAHSLGAVRSSLARYLIPSTTLVRITNFGAPKGANDAFYDYVLAMSGKNTVIERVLAERDFAGDWQPLLPYSHPTEYFYWLNNGTINFVNQRDWLNLSFADHSIDNSYIPLLLNLATVKI